MSAAPDLLPWKRLLRQQSLRVGNPYLCHHAAATVQLSHIDKKNGWICDSDHTAGAMIALASCLPRRAV